MPDLAYVEQRPLMLAFTRAVMTACSYLLILTTLLVLGLIILVSPGGRRVSLAWRGHLGPAIGNIIALLPLLILLSMPLGQSVSFAWLFTLKTAPPRFSSWLSGFSCWPSLARVAIRMPNPLEVRRIPMPATLVAPLAMLILLVSAILAMPAAPGPTHPPAALQYLRKELGFAGLAGLLITLPWFVIGQVRRIRGGLPAGLIARTQMAIGSQTLLIVAVLLPLLLLANQRRDLGHQSAYAAAARNPIADKLGVHWFERYFAPAKAVLSSASACAP